MSAFGDFFKTFRLVGQISSLEKERSDLQLAVISSEAEYKRLHSQIESNQETLASLQEDIENTKGQIICEELKAYSYPSKKTSSAKLERELKDINYEITRLIASDSVISCSSTYTVNGSARKGADFQRFYGESLVISFNNYFDKKAKSITANNYAKNLELITKYYDRMNRRANIIGDVLSSKYLDLKLKSLKLLLDIKIVAAEERSKETEERRRLREQENLLREAEKAKVELSKKRRMYEQSLARALTEAERVEFEEKLKEIDKREADIDYRISNSRAGYLYVTATNAMPGMTKLGVTRRLNPLVRIQELSSASVPFPFICHGLIFSDDAFELETKIHDYFDKQRVNKNNRRKEFFAISPQEAIDVLRNKFNCEVHFVDEMGEESEEE